ncbi:hypothetical protein [Ruegeria sp. EL01]|jgi:hypothetical protein|uniref:hypothetical protein n=1 Tax=Ruegeria sp. EL01 TaxID=2107578 RepID=UPI000EA810F8|nr:hypothetical protein [Ruegeria sp. EL01]
MTRPEIHVDKYGHDPSGESFSFTATPQAVAEGLMTNTPVMLVYPDGRRVMAQRALITQKGLERLQYQIGGQS